MQLCVAWHGSAAPFSTAETRNSLKSWTTSQPLQSCSVERVLQPSALPRPRGACNTPRVLRHTCPVNEAYRLRQCRWLEVCQRIGAWRDASCRNWMTWCGVQVAVAACHSCYVPCSVACSHALYAACQIRLRLEHARLCEPWSIARAGMDSVVTDHSTPCQVSAVQLCFPHISPWRVTDKHMYVT
jgi:hypothetical protein